MKDNSFSYKYDRRYENVLDNVGEHKKVNKEKNMILITHSPRENYRIESHFHDWYEFTYVEYGVQEITVGVNKIRISQGDFLLIPSGTIHESVALENCGKITYMIQRSFLETFVPYEMLKRINCNTKNIVTVEEFYKYKNLIEVYVDLTNQFLQLWEHDTIVESLKLKAVLFKFLYLLVENFTEKEVVNFETNQRSGDALVSELTSHIHKNYDKNITLNEVAKLYNYTPQYISKTFKMYKDTTFMNVVNEIRLEHAVYDIIHTDKLITEICYESGFGNLKSFGAAFKSKFGITPSDFREKYKKG